MMNHEVPIEVSARHVHLSEHDFKLLFGESGSLTVYKDISQPTQFASNEHVEIVGPKGSLKVRIVGPLRADTQVELSTTDCRQIGLEPLIRVSGDLNGSTGCKIRSQKAEIELRQGVIVAQRHLHISPAEAQKYGLKHGDTISISTSGGRPITFHNVFVRSRAGIDKMSFMIDTDEANAAGLTSGSVGKIVST